MKLSAYPALCVLILGAAGNIASGAEPVRPLIDKHLTAWKAKHPEKSHWTAGTATVDPQNPAALRVAPGSGELINAEAGSDLYTEQKFGDGLYEVEFMIPRGANSGIYLLGEYEIQVLDSFGKTHIDGGDMGALYTNRDSHKNAVVPKVNASRAPGQWQTFVIDFRAPRFDAAGNKIANARVVKATLNGQLIHENVAIKGSTGAALTGREAATGPLMFQGDHGVVAYRNIQITPAAGAPE